LKGNFKVSEPKVIYLGPACEASTGDGRTWAEDNPWPDCDCGHRPVQYVLGETFDRMKAERDALQLRLNAADQRIDELTPPVSPDPVTWGAPKTVRQLIQQLQTLDQDLRPLSMLRVPGNVFEDGKERTRAVHLSISHERVDGQWLTPFKSEGEKVLAFWCRMERPAPMFGFPVVIDPTLAPDEMRLVMPAARRTDEVQFKGMIETIGGEFAIMIDEANAHYGWTFKRHPDGMWVSGRKATDAEMHAARTHARITNQL
jgi:hypothetical protein